MINRLGHITLSLLLFVSSTGVLLNLHYCQKELKSAALFVDPEPCHMQQVQSSCPMHPDPPPTEERESKGCCDYETKLLKSDTEQQISVTEFESQLSPVLFSVLYVALQLELPTLDAQTLHYLNYKPPLIVCDLPVRLQTFRC